MKEEFVRRSAHVGLAKANVCSAFISEGHFLTLQPTAYCSIKSACPTLLEVSLL